MSLCSFFEGTLLLRHPIELSLKLNLYFEILNSKKLLQMQTNVINTILYLQCNMCTYQAANQSRPGRYTQFCGAPINVQYNLQNFTITSFHYHLLQPCLKKGTIGQFYLFISISSIRYFFVLKSTAKKLKDIKK